MKRRLLLNSASQGTLFGVNLVVVFLLSPIVIRELGNRDYGIWEILLSLLGYLSILDLGVSPAFIRFIAHAAARDDREHINRIVSSALVFLFLIGLAGFLVLNGAASVSDRFRDFPPGETQRLALVALFAGTSFLIQFTGTAFSAYLMGLQHHVFINIVQVVLTVIRGVVTYLALTSWPGSGLVWLAAILAATNAVQYSAYAVRALTLAPSPRIARRHLSWTTMKDLFSFGAKSVVLMVADRVSNWSVPMIIGIVLGAAHVVIFSIPKRLAVYAGGLANAIGMPMAPYFANLDGRGDRVEMQRAWFQLSRLLQFLMFGMAVAYLGLGAPFIGRWIGPAYGEGSTWVVRFLGCALLVEGLAPNAGRVLVSMNRHGQPAKLALVIALAALPTAVLLTVVAGVPGVAAAVLFARSAHQAMMTILACRALDLGVAEHLRRTALRFLVPVTLGLGTIAGLRVWRVPDEYPEILLYAAAGCAAYASAVWRFTLGTPEKTALRRLIRRRAPGSPSPPPARS